MPYALPLFIVSFVAVIAVALYAKKMKWGYLAQELILLSYLLTVVVAFTIDATRTI
jgi:hypothetical protein